MTGREYSAWGPACCFVAGSPLQGSFSFRRLCSAAIERTQFSMAKSKTKGVSKASAAARDTAAAAASAASVAAAAAAAARLPPAEGTRPATRSSPALEPDGTAALRAIGDLANDSSQPRTADVPRPRADGPSPGAQATINEADELRARTEALRAELDAARQRIRDQKVPSVSTQVVRRQTIVST